MAKKEEFRVGEIVEVDYRKKVVGYLFKELEDRIMLSPTTEIDDKTEFKIVFKKDMLEVSSFAKEPERKQEQEPEEMGKLVEFPPNQQDGGEGA